jgi:hypothetical protein
VTRAFHGSAQGTASASANRAPGFDSTDPANIAKAPASQGAEALTVVGHGNVSPQFAAATMHNDLSDDAKQLANGDKNVPIHPDQVATEGSDKQGWGGDAAQHDPTGQGRGG